VDQGLVHLILLSLPLAAQGRKELVRLDRGLVVAEGLRRRDEGRVKVHEDWSGTEDDIAVTFAEHAGLVAEAEDAGLAVAEGLLLVRR